ncbi:penicillin-binding protein [Putridiphycobacter roseus]|uniref:Penicillin-binding protein n=2 Tax=Putridiphycobacter roseus TaxID=2219161 RepID=A0A2W1MWG7_9FLAO|nr:penicillin-binding protein [Putridiphycobacter roseus]
MLERSKSNIPAYEELSSPPDKQASIILSEDKVEMGRFWSVNRKSISYKAISQNVISALVATEDKRYYDHAGVDSEGLGRALGAALIGKNKGGASTITQQLAKLLYTMNDTVNGGLASSKFGRLKQKFGENVLAVRLEKAYTKEEIITMYLNNFDFLNNAVGIETAAHVYFNKKPIDLKIEEAAMLVGMCKNPSIFNPLRHPDTTKHRRNVVLNQWRKDADNEFLAVSISQAQYDSIKTLPLGISYQKVDHKEGLAPHFKEVLRAELQNKFKEKNPDGSFVYAKQDGSPYNIYRDGLRIYTTINSKMQTYAEAAVQKHLATRLQNEFDKSNKRNKNPPFANDRENTPEAIARIMNRAMKRSDRYRQMKRGGKSESEIKKAFNTPIEMNLFAYTGNFDTIMSPLDSIRYYKGFLQASLMSMDPKTGFVKAWVGGPNFNYFALDHVKRTKRQVGSTIKPFVYAAAMGIGVIDPCKTYADISYGIDVPVSPTRTKSWNPATGTKNTGELIPAKCGLAGSLNNITVAVMREMGATAGPQTMNKLLKQVGIDLLEQDVVPAMCLGPMSLSLYDMVGAQSTFANKGIYIKPVYVMRVEDKNGNVLIDLEYEMHEAMPEELAYSMLGMMKGAVNGAANPYQNGKVYATSSSLRSSQPWGGIKAPTAGKTGTTNSAADGWFMGLTPDLVTGVWVGADDKQIHFRSYPWGQGARMALPIYGYYMQEVYKDKKLKISTSDFERPRNYNDDIFRCKNEDTNIDGLF